MQSHHVPLPDPHQQQQQQLPPGWVAATDPVSGTVYYANPTTGETQWTPPMIMMTPVGSSVPSTTNVIPTQPLGWMPRVQSVLARKNGELSVECSAGTIADLCNVRRSEQPDREFYYEPLDPCSMSRTAQPPSIESGRVDIRLASLQSKLRDI